MKEVFRILAINPGSTSTKIAVYDNSQPVMEQTIRHENGELSAFNTILEQRKYREDIIRDTLVNKDIPMESLSAVVGRGGLITPIKSGTYTINEKMLRDLTDPQAAVHASSLGGIIAKDLGDSLGIPSYIVDPVVVDERDEIAKITGLPEIRRNSIWHALNQKAVGRICAEYLDKEYDECRFIIAHMGGGISIGAHKYGKVVDVTDGLLGEGPMTPERTGALPAANLIDLCFSGKYTREELRDFITKKGGLTAHLGTNNMIEVEKMIDDGDEMAELMFKSMAYQIAKAIGSMYAVLQGTVDSIILTGGLAHSIKFTGAITEYVRNLCSIIIYPGEDEMEALAQGALRVLKNLEDVKEY